MHKKNQQSGFTLVELAIVLVIIGLIVGGVLVGQDLIKAATVRAAVTQLERYDTAANTFRNKYNGLPGDLSAPTNFFSALTAASVATATGIANGNGVIETISATGSPDTLCAANTCISGEGSIFWYELAQAGLISEQITTVDAAAITLAPSDAVLPASKLSKTARIAVQGIGNRNYWVIGNFGSVALAAGGSTTTYTAGTTPLAAYQIDVKVDDGLPGTGKMISIAIGTALPGTAATGATAGTTCASGVTAADVYSTTTNADTVGCSLSIRTSF